MISPMYSFDVPQIALFSDLVAFMDTHPDYEVDGSYTGVKSDKFKLNYTQMYNDLKVSYAICRWCWWSNSFLLVCNRSDT